MDPTANLKEQLELAEKIDLGHGLERDTERLAELVLALHEWIEKVASCQSSGMGARRRRSKLRRNRPRVKRNRPRVKRTSMTS